MTQFHKSSESPKNQGSPDTNGDRDKQLDNSVSDNDKKDNCRVNDRYKPGSSVKGRNDAYYVTLSALLSALALIFSYVEYLLPFHFGIPGIKIGLANLVIITALYELDFKYTLIIDIIRILLSSMLFSGINAMFYSMAGGLISLFLMAILKKTGLFSIIGVSMAGGAAHNLGQLIVASIMVSNINMFLYFPVLLIAGIFTGIGIGIVAYIFIDRVNKSLGNRLNGVR